MVRADRGEPATPIIVVDKTGFDEWLMTQPAPVRAMVAAQAFTGEANAFAVVSGDGPREVAIVAGVTDASALGPWCLARMSEKLAVGTYRLVGTAPGHASLGWLLGQYRFDRYKADDVAGARVLLTSEPASIDAQVAIADAVTLVRDLVNTPAADMGPQQMEDAVADAARTFGATLSVTRGDALEREYPMVAAVGRAATRPYAPRMLELEWGDPAHPRIAIVGKGVSFDSGGLDIKPASGMRLMKKDMGGAAHAIALARLIMGVALPVRLHLLIPAAENAIAGDAFRPGDILRSRAGLSVEIHNTDAEGRLLLADALTRAGENAPELTIDFATLTGAARTALGPDLPALFCNDDALAAALLDAGESEADPMWRLPLWPGYADMLKSDVADVSNASDSALAGAITAALFLERFVPEGAAWAHLDTFAWMPADKPGRHKGGEALGLRAAWRMLRTRYGAVR